MHLVSFAVLYHPLTSYMTRHTGDKGMKDVGNSLIISGKMLVVFDYRFISFFSFPFVPDGPQSRTRKKRCAKDRCGCE